MEDSQVITLKARWVWPRENSPSIAAGAGYLAFAADRIVGCFAEPPSTGPVIDLGNSLLLPRFVNAHTHLEFSSLPRPFPAESGFPSWIRQVIQSRQSRDSAAAGGGLTQPRAIACGLAESNSRGVGLLGEIATSPWPVDAYSAAPASVIFLEQLGVLPGQAEERLAAVATRLGELRGSGLKLGLSPHAPYSLSERLYHGLLDLAEQQRLPVAMHLAETRDEVEWLQGFENGFTHLQTRLGIPVDQQWRPTVAGLLQRLARLERVLVIHGNYLRPADWQILAKQRQRMSLVFCPRTHAHFSHPRYPLPELLKAGVRVVVGTDSRASNPDLDILAELRLLRQLYPELSSEQIFALGTTDSAEALGESARWGSFREGASAEFLIVSDLPPEMTDPLEWLLAGPVSPRALDRKEAAGLSHTVRR